MVGAAGAREHAADQRVVSSSGALQVSSSTRNSSENRAADRPGRAPQAWSCGRSASSSALVSSSAPGKGLEQRAQLAGGRPLRRIAQRQALAEHRGEERGVGVVGLRVAQQRTGQQAGGLVGDQGVIHEGRLRKRKAGAERDIEGVNQSLCRRIYNESIWRRRAGRRHQPVARTRPACRRQQQAQRRIDARVQARERSPRLKNPVAEVADGAPAGPVPGAARVQRAAPMAQPALKATSAAQASSAVPTAAVPAADGRNSGEPSWRVGIAAPCASCRLPSTGARGRE